MKIQNKKSGIANAGVAKKPTAAATEYGELCINYNHEDPSLFIRVNDKGTDADSIVKVGGDLSKFYTKDEINNLDWDTTVADGRYLRIDADAPDQTRVSGRTSFTDSVGIGTTNPQAQLHLTKDSNPKIRLQDEGGLNRYSDIISAGGNLYFDAVNNTSNAAILFRGAGGTEHMRINVAGKVGIGTSNPGVKLSVLQEQAAPAYAAVASFGTTSISEGLYIETQDGNLVWGLGTLNQRDLAFRTNQLNRLRIKGNTGNVGIGTDNPSTKLDVAGPIASKASDYPQCRLIRENAGAGLTNADWRNFVRNNGNYAIKNAETDIDVVVVTKDNKVGIGPAAGAPATELHVDGNGYFSGNTYVGGVTSRNTFELWKSTLTEEQLEQLEAGTLVAPANVAIPGDGSFARQWWYDQQSAEDQALLDSGEAEYPEHLAAATFTDTFAIGDNTKINLYTDGRGAFKAGLSVIGQHPSGVNNLDKLDSNLFPMIWANNAGNLRMMPRGNASTPDPAIIIMKPGVVEVQHQVLTGSAAAGRESLFRVAGEYQGNFGSDWVTNVEVNPNFNNISGSHSISFPVNGILVRVSETTGFGLDNTVHFAAYTSGPPNGGTLTPVTDKPASYQAFRSRLVLDHANSSNAWHFYGEGNAKSYFGGNVGIGTDAPNRLLTITDSVQPQLSLQIGTTERLRMQSLGNTVYHDCLNAQWILRGGEFGNETAVTVGIGGLVVIEKNLQVKGTINGNFSLRMQTDDPAAYQTVFSTDDEGNQVEQQEYIGTTEDVLDIITDLRTRLAGIEANEVVDDATDSSLLSLIADLADRVTALENP